MMHPEEMSLVSTPGGKSTYWDKTTRRLNIIIVILSVACLALVSLMFVIVKSTESGAANTSNIGFVNVQLAAVSEVWTHLLALQHAADKNNGTRVIGSSGFEASVHYVLSQLASYPDYFDVIVQDYFVTTREANDATTLSYKVAGAPVATTMQRGTDFSELSYTGSGQGTDVSTVAVANRGCEEVDYAGLDVHNAVAVILRGNCTFLTKAVLAQKQGAKAVLIVNSASGSFRGTLSSDAIDVLELPVLGLDGDLANVFLEQSVQVSYSVTAVKTTVKSHNIIATTKNSMTKANNESTAVVFGSHLDSVKNGPGINDNGSGTSVNLAVALALAKQRLFPRNELRFAWWGGEEEGLTGSKFYVSNLTESQKEKIALNFNMDMLGSPNFERGIYNASATADPKGCKQLTDLIVAMSKAENLPYTLEPFNGRSDYAPFADEGIAAGGIFTGAEEKKSMELRELYGGMANTAYDPCYHADCDTIENISQDAIWGEAKIVVRMLNFFANHLTLRKWLYS